MNGEDKGKIEYQKKPKTLEGQVDKLLVRGLLINDRDFAKNKLRHINYYDLSAYFKFYQYEDNTFKEGTTFEDVINIFNFDIRLRLFLLNLLGQVEKSFKCILTYEVAVRSGNSHWYYDSDMYSSVASHEEMKGIIINEAHEARGVRNEAVLHYYETYSDPVDPPIWTMIDILSFGQSVLLYRKLSDVNRRLIAGKYNFQSIGIFYNWFFVMTKLRNACAHHSRVWNNTINIPILTRVSVYKNLFNNHSNRRLFNYLMVLQIFLNKIRETSGLIDGVKQLVDDHNIDVSNMGFPKDWEFRLKKIIEIENNYRQ